MVNFFDTRIGRRIREWKYKRVFNKLSPGEIAIDCGANVGKVTAKMAEKGATVYAFEPDPNAFKALEAKVGQSKNVILINKAVSDHDGREKIYFTGRYSEDPQKWSVASTLLPDKPQINTSTYSEVEVIDLAEFIKQLKSPVGLLKMDIEGEEVKVLNKLIDLNLTKNIRNILVETHERFPTLTEPTRKLKERIRELGLKNIDLDWA